MGPSAADDDGDDNVSSLVAKMFKGRKHSQRFYLSTTKAAADFSNKHFVTGVARQNRPPPSF